MAGRCEVHGTVRTASGTCLLCERRKAPSSTALPWTLAVVVALLVASAAGYRAYLDVRDARAKTATATPAATATVVPARELAPLPPTTADDRASLVAAAEREVQIEMYGAAWCPSCRKAKAWLDGHGVAYTYRDTEQPANNQAMRALNARGTIPTIKIDDQVLVGYSDAAMRNAIRRAAEARVASR